MKKSTVIVMCCLLLFACSIGCTSKKSKFEESAGNLNTEIIYVYDYFERNHDWSPRMVAKDWCNRHQSWEYKEKKFWDNGYYLETSNKKHCIQRLDINTDVFEVYVKDHKYEEVCQAVKSIFGPPDSSGTSVDGHKSSVWNDVNGIEIDVSSRYYDYSTDIYFFWYE